MEAGVAASESELGPGPLLLRTAQPALAPAAEGGAGCGGANLAWYLQYGKPQLQPRRGRAALRLTARDLQGAPGTGLLFARQLLVARAGGGGGGSGNASGDASGNGNAAATGIQGWVVVVSGANPCSSFRAWLSVTIEQPGAPAAPSGTQAAGEAGAVGGDAREALEAEARRSLAAPARTVRHDVEVTPLAAPLPALVRAGRWPVRVRSEWHDVTQGRDYQSRAAWLLLLPPSAVAPLLQQPGAPHLGLDLAALAAGGSGSGGGGPPDSRTVTVTLTVWLAEPSHAPAFRLVAAPLPAQVPGQGGGAAGGGVAGGNAARAAAGGEEDDGLKDCLHTAVLLVGGGAGGVLQVLWAVSANRTYYSLERCAADPRGCSAVAAVLDPACKYRLELVPYISGRLPALLLANAGRLWLGAQLLALLAVAALTVAEATGAAEAEAAGHSDSNGDGASASVAGNHRRRRRRFGGWVLLPAEGLHVLQSALGPSRRSLELLAWTAVASVLLAWAAPPPHLEAERGGAAPEPDADAVGADAAQRSAPDLPRLLWPAVRLAAQVAGLCPQAHRPDCGWSPSYLPLGMLFAGDSGSTGGGRAMTHESAAEPQCALDWLALAAAALLACWLLTAVLQAAAAVAGVLTALLQATWFAVLTLPCRVLLVWPAGATRRALRRRFSGQACESVEGDAGLPRGDDERRAGLGAIGRCCGEAAVVAALVSLAGAPSAVPAAVLLASVLALARALTAPTTVLAGGPLPASASALLRPSARAVQWERRRHLAWLLYYAAYGASAAPAVAAALRRLLLRPRALAALLAAAGAGGGGSGGGPVDGAVRR
ncbi:hypothetical protein GPECTOR_33g635 [Gonium pectorale]|uniref:Uncharacterized protein n=1 Tax=Gonium pectorale TaxID=33097 RepID=A0A150GDA1_GONPE|nr:hypothetical protein GPECTOR_33g635 [Gonium pectorale]|eukprot:KXZ47753.1 hypothetical protein GPECTOR_33g635 [Gonium pectorale]